MGFFRQQQENLAIRLILWQYKKNNLPLPSAAEIEAKASQIVDDAHRIAKMRGQNVISIIKDMIGDMKK